MTITKDTDPRIVRFIERLAELEPGDRARLKRNAGLTLGEAHQAIGLFYRILPANLPVYQEPWYFLIATLYPLADAGQTGNFGSALKRARSAQHRDGLDRRIEILLDADEAQLPFRLRQAVRFLYAQGVPVDWEQLLDDLLRWTHPERYVQRQWASAYFAS
jgi:CRISPR system Cascade subunit CasB